MKISRRKFIAGVAISASVVGIGMSASGRKVVEVQISAQNAKRNFIDGVQTDVMAYNDTVPIIRIKKGEVLKATLINNLDEMTTIHWHGVRVPNNMDGVPVLTQPAVPPKGQFTYEFECIDAGSFYFHTHMGSKRQMGRGMIGLLIIEDETHDQYDNDIAWGYHDQHLGSDGQPISDDMSLMHNRQGAMLGGVYGNFPTVNGVHIDQNIQEVVAGSIVRLRLLNVDNSRILKLALYQGSDVYKDAKIIAIDGNAISEPMALDRYRMGPANRLDIAIRMPTQVGAEISLANVFLRDPVSIGILKTVAGSPKKQSVIFPPMPKINPIPVPNLKEAEILPFVFHNMAVKSTNGESDPIWGINEKAWSSEGSAYPEPIAKLKVGKSYIFRLKNISKFSHPIHMHGHTWWVVRSNKKNTITGYHTDTVLIRPRETIDVAFVADNIGAWMYHCHIIDHMVTGMMSWVQVGDIDVINKAKRLTPEQILGLGGWC